MSNDLLVPPYGGKLVSLLVAEEERTELTHKANTLPSIQLSNRSLCDLELLAIGGFSPLDRFMGKADYDRVVEEMRLVNGTLFPMPITLPIDEDTPLRLGKEIALRDSKNNLMAVMKVEEEFAWDADREAHHVCGSLDARHPLIAEMETWGKVYISGPLRVINLPRAYDFTELRLPPVEVRRRLSGMGHHNVVAFQTRNPLHRIHEELTKRAMADINGALLLHPAVGLTKPGDVDHYTRVRIYKTLVKNYYDPQRALLSLLPLAMRMAGPREAVWHAIIRRNYGANHFIVGRDHAGPGKDSSGKPFYGPYDAQELLVKHSDEVGVKMVPFRALSYLPDEDRYVEETEVPPGAKVFSISGTQVRSEYLANGKPLPAWFTRPETAAILGKMSPPRHRQGFCLWFTGLSGAGKSTTAEALTSMLLEQGRQVTILDGAAIRTHISKGLGFSKEDRDINIRRIGFIAAEIVRHKGIVITAAISPYRTARNDCRRMIGENFIEVFVDTPLEVCIQRDDKGFYSQSQRGDLHGLTGIDDPYEPPLDPEILLDGANYLPEQNARRIFEYLVKTGLLLEDETEAVIRENGGER
ncbi:MAG: bifunctional sulfate adenylyltransferase/adenylylsulfate kinase [Anaerolineae bacterium]